MKRANNLPLAILAALALAGAILLPLLGRPIPDFIVLCTTALVGAVAGVTMPAGASSSTDLAAVLDRLAPPAPAPVPVPAPAPEPEPAAAPAAIPLPPAARPVSAP